MKDNKNNYEKNAQNEQSSQNIKDEVSAIKGDMKTIFERMGNVKGDASNILWNEMSHMMSNMNHMKEKAYEHGKEGVESLACSIQKNPIRSLMYGFGAGMILALLFKK